MKEKNITRRSFLKAGAVASALGMMAAAPVEANAAAHSVTAKHAEAQ